MGKLADAIRERRKGSQRRLGFGAAAAEPEPSMLVGSIGAAAGADFYLFDEGDELGGDQADRTPWGARLAAANLERTTEMREAGADFVMIWLDYTRADALLDEELDYVIRVPNTRVEDSDARALGSLRPTLIVPNLSFPLRLPGLLELRRMALLTGAPMGVIADPYVSESDLQLLRDSGVAVVLIEGAYTEEITAIKRRIVDLPERKTRRDGDLHPLLPTPPAGGGEDDEARRGG